MNCRWNLVIAFLSLAGTLAMGQTINLTPAPTNLPPRPAPNPSLPTVFVVGDSTASNGPRGGWGDPFSDYFDATRVNVCNRALGGRSSRSFQTEGHWDKVLAEMKAGDVVLIQMGQNDGGPLDTGRARGSLPGIGDQTREIDMPSGKEVVHTYGWYMRKYITDTKAKGATPILLTLTAKNIFDDGKNRRPYDNYPKWTAEVAQAMGVQVLDHLNIVGQKFDKMGQEAVRPLFRDQTHTSAAGADVNAAGVVAGLKALNSPLVQYLNEKGKQVEPYTRLGEP